MVYLTICSTIYFGIQQIHVKQKYLKLMSIGQSLNFPAGKVLCIVIFIFKQSGNLSKQEEPFTHSFQVMNGALSLKLRDLFPHLKNASLKW